MSSAASATWRCLSVPQRKALRHLRDRQTATVGSWNRDVSWRCACCLILKGFAEWREYGYLLQVTAAGLEVVNGR